MRKRYSKPNGANVICHLQAAFVRFVAEETNRLCDLSKEPSFCLYYLTVWQSCRAYSNLEFSFCSADIPHWLHNFPSAGLNFFCLILATNPQKAPAEAPENSELGGTFIYWHLKLLCFKYILACHHWKQVPIYNEISCKGFGIHFVLCVISTDTPHFP